MGWKFPEIPRPRSVVHLHYLEHFGASANESSYTAVYNKYIFFYLVVMPCQTNTSTTTYRGFTFKVPEI